jgi:hypothetical protein
MLLQGTGGSVTSITTSMAEHPIAGVPASIPMKRSLPRFANQLLFQPAKRKRKETA